MSTETVVSPELEKRLRSIVQDELHRRDSASSEDWSLEQMQAAIARIRERRKRIALPPGVLEALIEETRREFGRGPLVEDENTDGDA